MWKKLSVIDWRLVQLVVLMFALLVYAGIQELSENRTMERESVPVSGKSSLLQQTEPSPKNRIGMISALFASSAFMVIYSVA